MKEHEVIKLIGMENWDKFIFWMGGQTVGVYSDGSTNYYEDDVRSFVTKLEKGYDRQADPMAWD